MAFSTKLARRISSLASLVYFLLLVIFQIPLFRVPCRCGICTTPIQVTWSHLMATEILPIANSFFTHAVLIPGSFFFSAATAKTPTVRNSILLCDMNDLNLTPFVITDIRYIEILIGSYLSVAGAILGLTRRKRNGKLSFFGMLLLSWGLVKESVIVNSSQRQSTNMHPVMFLLTLIISFLSVKSDVKAIVKCFRTNYKKLHNVKTY